MKPYRAACQRWRKVWATKIPRGFIKPTENSATRSPPDIGSPAKATGGGSPELSGSAMPPGCRRYWSSHLNRTGRPRFIRSLQNLAIPMTDTSIRSIRICVVQSARRSRWQNRANRTKYTGPWKKRSTNIPRHAHGTETPSGLLDFNGLAGEGTRSMRPTSRPAQGARC